MLLKLLEKFSKSDTSVFIIFSKSESVKKETQVSYQFNIINDFNLFLKRKVFRIL